MNGRPLPFDCIEKSSRRFLPLLLLCWLPDGRREGREWVACLPARVASGPGSFKIDLQTGKWADLATGENGRDVIGLAGYLHGLSRPEAASKISEMLGMHQRGRS